MNIIINRKLGNFCPGEWWHNGNAYSAQNSCNHSGFKSKVWLDNCDSINSMHASSSLMSKRV